MADVGDNAYIADFHAHKKTAGRVYPKFCVNRSKMQNEAVEFEPDGDLPPGFVIIYDTGHLLQ